MSDPYFSDEPIPDHLADTGPIQTINHTEDASDRAPAWRRGLGLVSLLGATLLTVAAIMIILSPGGNGDPEPPVVLNVTEAADEESIPTATPLQAREDAVNPVGEPVEAMTILPTLNPERMARLLSAPLTASSDNPSVDYEAVRNIHNPFTIIPERTRSSVEQYTIESGDTIFAIAERYGLEPETIVWGNDHTITEGLRPGRVINILPVDGVYRQVLNHESVTDLATRYRVDPYAILDSEYNELFGISPDDPLPEGAWIVVPGGEDVQPSWNPVVQRVEAGSSGASGGQGTIAFAPGDPGSCGTVTNPGGTGWVRPISGYQWIRGFSGVHSGVDLSAPVGTPVYAANGGAVIFSGWSTWGYGYTVVLAHGPYTTVYGHLSAISVGCAQYVSAGQPIGAVGSSGNSSGPHLHFEIRYLDTPSDPTYTIPF